METAYAEPQEFVTRSEGDRHYIEGLCVPYGKITHRAGPTPEQFERGAFAALLASGGRVKLTDYNHAEKRVPVGYSEALEDRPAGLWGRFRLNRTPEGTSAHANAAEGVYQGLSVGFIAKKAEMRGGVRHVLQAHLDHVSLVEDPAYSEAEILAVRSTGVDLEPFRALIAPPDALQGLDIEMPGSLTIAIAQLRSRRDGTGR